MTRKVVIFAVVLGAVIAVLALKTSPRDETSPTAAPVAPVAVQLQQGATAPARTVLLFADPREAESSCGCAEVIRIACAAGNSRVWASQSTTPDTPKSRLGATAFGCHRWF